MLAISRHEQCKRGHCQWIELVVRGEVVYIGVTSVKGKKVRLCFDGPPAAKIGRVFTSNGEIPSQQPSAVVREMEARDGTTRVA